MSSLYSIAFRPSAAKAFKKLDLALQRQFARKLDQRSFDPIVPSARVRNIPNAYKIKLRSSGFRLIYLVRDRQLVILVLSIGRRDREEAYGDAISEFRKLDD